MSSLPEHDEFSTHAVPTDARVASFRVAAVASMVPDFACASSRSLLELELSLTIET
jgi:hypothetical protein